MKISFLVTYYNQEQYVRESINSILAIEKPEEWELLVGDDGSTDKTQEIVNEFAEKDPFHVKLYIMPRDENGKYNAVLRASANRLNLIEHCTGDCFCVLDGDDYYCDNHFVKEAIKILEENDDISFVLYGYQMKYEDNRIREKLLPIGSNQRVNTKRYICGMYAPAGAGVHRLNWGKERIEYIKKTGFFDDNDIVMNGLNYGSIYYINRCIYTYRQIGESIYNTMSEIEKSILNMQGYDVARLLIGKAHQNELKIRYGNSILMGYFENDQIRRIINEEKLNQYIEECRVIEGSITYYILRYQDLDGYEKKKVRQLIREIAVRSPRVFGKRLINHIWKMKLL